MFCPMVEALAILLFMAVELMRTAVVVVEIDSSFLVAAASARCVVVRAWCRVCFLCIFLTLFVRLPPRFVWIDLII